MIRLTLLTLGAVALVKGQRPFFAGSKPIGYPEIHATTDGLTDRFGEVDGTTQRLPIEANGDRELVNRLSKLPIDKQPFWLINWLALEAHRQNPQTYPQKPNVFIEPSLNQNSNTGILGNSVVQNPTSNSGNSNPGNLNSNTGISGSANSGTLSANVPNVGTANRNSFTNVNSVPASGNAGTISTNRNTVYIPTSTVPSYELGNRFGGIELNTYRPESDPIHSNIVNSYFKPGTFVNTNSKNIAPKRSR